MAGKVDPRLTPEQANLIRKSRELKANGARYRLDDASLAALIGFIERDFTDGVHLEQLPDEARPDCDYYNEDPYLANIRAACQDVDLVALFLEASEAVPDFERLFETMCELHKRRSKMKTIRASKELPLTADLSFRGLLADPDVPADVLATQLRLGKYFYDLDNRLAQETALLFNIIIANCLGGRGYTGMNSPIMRSTDGYQGRAVDCIVGQRAYDFKGRLTEAPSRRARLRDELAFPRDCYLSGYTPILLAFHRKPSEKTEEFITAYERYGGMALIGNEAWYHIREEAGPAMGRFLDRYVLTRIEEIEAIDTPPLDMTFRIREGYKDLVFKSGRQSSCRIRLHAQ